MKSIWSGIFKLVISSTLIFLILWKVGIDRISQTWQDLRHFEILAAFAISPIVAFLGAYKWKLMVQAVRLRPTWKEAMRSFLSGMGVGLLTPMRVGELSRIFFLRGNRDVLLGVALVDKAVDLQSLLILAVIGSALAFGPLTLSLFSGAVLAVFVLLLYPSPFISLFRWTVTYIPLMKKLERMVAAIEAFPTKWLLFCLSIRFVVCLVDMVQFTLLINAFTPSSPTAILASYPLIVLINTFPLTISGLGLREGAAAVILSEFGVPAAAAVSASFLLFTINTLIPGLLGALLMPQGTLAHIKKRLA